MLYHKNDQILLWKKVSELLGSNVTDRYGTNTLLEANDSVEEINIFFAGVGERVIVEIPDRPYHLLDQEVKDTGLNHSAPLTVSGFLKIVTELKISKSSGIKGLNSRVIIKAMKTIQV